jgi:hypothetical protein
MIVINSPLCSDSAQRAFAALDTGKAVRLDSWPVGQYIQRQASGIVSVVRAGSEVRPPWMGPSRAEQDATNWQVL